MPGRLTPIPLHAAGQRVPLQTHQGGTAWRGFLDDFAVSYVPSPQALVDARAHADEPARQGRSLLAVTNPTGDARIDIATNPAWSAFPAGQRRDLRHGQATIAAVAAAIGPQGPGWSHFSLYCHGGFDPADPEGSGLELADGRLSPRRLRSLLLATVRLAFLGACESGMIGMDLADEAIGIPVSLLEANIPAVAASHWSVSADATRLLAETFFGLLLHHALSPAKALRLAQLGLRDAAIMAAAGGEGSVMAAAEAMLRTRRACEDGTDQAPPPPVPPRRDDGIDPRHHAPVYWAAFSLTGL
jgi:CHAT domain-containing protein